MRERERAGLVGCSAWIAGRLVVSLDDARAAVAGGGRTDGGKRATLPIDPSFGPARIPRADRATQLVATAVARALTGIDASLGDATGVITASVLASADTNDQFERRRLTGRPAAPRSFPYTAPNATAGELSMALRARGPTTALAGGAEVGVAAVALACSWLEDGDAERVVVAAYECPAEPAPPWLGGPGPHVECAVALVLDAVPSGGSLRIGAYWMDRTDAVRESRDDWRSRCGSVGPLLPIVGAARARTPTSVVVVGDAGGGVRLELSE